MSCTASFFCFSSLFIRVWQSAHTARRKGIVCNQVLSKSWHDTQFNLCEIPSIRLCLCLIDAQVFSLFFSRFFCLDQTTSTAFFFAILPVLTYSTPSGRCPSFHFSALFPTLLSLSAAAPASLSSCCSPFSLSSRSCSIASILSCARDDPILFAISYQYRADSSLRFTSTPRSKKKAYLYAPSAAALGSLLPCSAAFLYKCMASNALRFTPLPLSYILPSDTIALPRPSSARSW
mmetsp:Transcript_45555/g.117732  ORF Transcript_45555/g.117732 Transcript_45555/m.117732 type:complete len:234 (-) Transcript_45555:927-1628(-)